MVAEALLEPLPRRPRATVLRRSALDGPRPRIRRRGVHPPRSRLRRRLLGPPRTRATARRRDLARERAAARLLSFQRVRSGDARRHLEAPDPLYFQAAAGRPAAL